MKDLVKEGGIFELGARLQEKTKADVSSVTEEEKEEVAQKIAIEQAKLKEKYNFSSSDFNNVFETKINDVLTYLKDSVFTEKDAFKYRCGGCGRDAYLSETFWEVNLSNVGVSKYNNSFNEWQVSSEEIRNDLYEKLIAFDNEDRLIKEVTSEASSIIKAYNQKQKELSDINNQIDDLNKQLEALDGGGDIATANSERQKAIDEKNKLEAQKDALNNQVTTLAPKGGGFFISCFIE